MGARPISAQLTAQVRSASLRAQVSILGALGPLKSLSTPISDVPIGRRELAASTKILGFKDEFLCHRVLERVGDGVTG